MKKDFMTFGTMPTNSHAQVIKLQEEFTYQSIYNEPPTEFESVRAALTNRETSLDLDTCDA